MWINKYIGGDKHKRSLTNKLNEKKKSKNLRCIILINIYNNDYLDLKFNQSVE
jgi:hypothetical protein